MQDDDQEIEIIEEKRVILRLFYKNTSILHQPEINKRFDAVVCTFKDTIDPREYTISERKIREVAGILIQAVIEPFDHTGNLIHRATSHQQKLFYTITQTFDNPNLDVPAFTIFTQTLEEDKRNVIIERVKKITNFTSEDVYLFAHIFFRSFSALPYWFEYCMRIKRKELYRKSQKNNRIGISEDWYITHDNSVAYYVDWVISSDNTRGYFRKHHG